MTRENLLIDGKRIPALSGHAAKVFNPATGDILAEVADSGLEDIDIAVQSAQRAFTAGPWRNLNSRDRTRLLLNLSQLIRKNSEELAKLETQNVGKPIREARDEVNLAADCFEYYAGAINKVGGQTIPVAAPGVCMTFREPIGVCGLILPWNFPIVIASWKIAPALAMANTVVVKPAEQTPLTALRLGELALEAGIPVGVLNVVPGRGEVAGEALVKHPLVRKISFTGSTEVGRKVMKLAAEDIKRVTLELGGKSANIVFADADFEKALPGAVSSVLGNAGQDCCARSRLLLEKLIYNQFISELTELFEKIRLGDPENEDTEMGSLISQKQHERVLNYVELGKNEGASLVCGGESPGEEEFKKGFFLNPTLFTDVKPEMRIAREEIFGPVLCAIPFDTEEEAIAIANKSTYGLSGAIWTKDIERALRVARAIETGVISINTGHSVHLEAPFGGVKQSGVGRELGLAALEHYSELKSVFIHTGC
ncbi:aldehyde dehydrogenase family protein [candidate division KSB1 bacterium]|nr:aldehyde dehydrogenase family protein [candidate division KSB1 bacterium]